MADNVTNEVKEAVSDETLKEIKAELEAGKADDTPVVPEIPKTGDTTNVFVYMVLLAVSCLAFAVAKKRIYK